MFLRHRFLSVITLLYLGFIGWLTLTPAPYDDRATGMLWDALHVFARHRSTDWVTFSLVEFLANIVIFVPVGVFLVLLFGRRQWWLAITFGVLLSCAIELAQLLWLSTRVPDLRDVVSNSSGCLIGVLVAGIITWPKARRGRLTRHQAARG